MASGSRGPGSPHQCAARRRRTSRRIDERDACQPFLDRELALLGNLRVLVALGSFGYQVLAGILGVRPRPKFGHGVEAITPAGLTIVCSYHVSQQNTFTGRLTEPMLDAVFASAREIGDSGGPQPTRASVSPTP